MLTTCEPENKAVHPHTGRPLRICHLAKFYPPATGGIESHLRTMAQAQTRLGASVLVVCVNHLDDKGNDVTWSTFASTPTVEDQDGEVKVIRMGRRASLHRFDLCPGLMKLRKLLRTWEADVIHLHVPNPTMLFALLPSAGRVPLFITYHSDVVRQKILRMGMRPFENWVYARSARILATSPPYADYSSTLRRHAKKVKVLPFGIDLEPYLQPTKQVLEYARRLKDRFGDPIWLCVGRLVYYKGLSTAIEALIDVPGKLLLIGEGPLRESLESQAQKLGVSDRVCFLGRAMDDEVIGAYHAATALWFPSNARSEAFGFAQVEAMASGCPVINTSIPGSGVPWVSRDEESGYTIPIGDSSALAQASKKLVEDSKLRLRLGENGKSRAIEEFDASRMAERTCAVYQEELTQRGYVKK